MEPLHIIPPYSIDRRDSSIIKPTIGTLFELTNMMIDQYSLQTRLGQNRTAYSKISSSAVTASHATNLIDTTAPPFLASMVGCPVQQNEDSYYGTITAYTSTSVVKAQLYNAAGVAQTWQEGKSYKVFLPMMSMLNGTCMGTAAYILADSDNDQFLSSMVGCVVRNLTQNTYGIITTYNGIDSVNAQLYTSAGIASTWTITDKYSLTYPIMALHRFYGLNPATGVQIKEFYAASGTGLYYWDTAPTPDQWTAFTLPPNITLQNSTMYPGRFRQLRDRTIYSNGYDPVLMIKKEDTQAYRAGIPDPDQYVMLQNCESEISFDDALAAGKWKLYGNGTAAKRRLWRDEHMTHHTEGDYGYCLEVEPETGLGDPITGVIAGPDNAPEVHAVYRFPAQQNLEWYFCTTFGQCTSVGDNTTLKATAGAFTDALIGNMLLMILMAVGRW